MGRITLPFRVYFQREMKNLRSFRDALMDLGRRSAFNGIVKAWSSEQGAMSYAKIPAVLDVMLLTAVVDNRKLIQNLYAQVEQVTSRIEKVSSSLDKIL